ncbi:MAG: VWA domain-containing protein [Bryobacteraceae bacterium]|jgi:VWFA-related protein
MKFAAFTTVFIALAAGTFAQSNDDAGALLARGTALIPSQPAAAVKILEQALRLDPLRADVRYELGLAYHAIGDEADAAAQLREALAGMPDSAPAHNNLGIALFQLGNAKASIDEFRAAAHLAPKDPNAHFNLGEALARTGDKAGAVEELSVAAGLAPTDAGLARLVKSVETALAPPPANTIKVDVRQVLVPVVVTDKQGHHITGLTQADFKIFEDGVEQKITAFSVESSGVPQVGAQGNAAPSATAAVVNPTPPQTTAQPAPRRTYLVLIDTLHLSFQDFVSAREALKKLFREEHSADSQYVVISLGATPQMILNVNRDPTSVLAVLESKRMQKIFLDGQQGGIQNEIERFRRDLNDTRLACDVSTDLLMKAKCEAGMSRAYVESGEIADLDRTLTIGFLRQFRSLVAQLAQGRDRRTIVLLSDGFQIVPGREAFDLVDAFFPYASHCMVPPTVVCNHNDHQQYGRLQDEFEPILKLAARNNITIDTIDARGLYGQASFDASHTANSVVIDGAVDHVERNVAADDGNTLAEIAEATGGTAFHDSNNLSGALERAFADGRDYYNLAYVSSNANLDGRFRAITVEVSNPKAVVTAKRGYWAVPAAQ